MDKQRGTHNRRGVDKSADNVNKGRDYSTERDNLQQDREAQEGMMWNGGDNGAGFPQISPQADSLNHNALEGFPQNFSLYEYYDSFSRTILDTNNE